MDNSLRDDSFKTPLHNSAQIVIIDQFQTFRDQTMMKKNLLAPQLYSRKRNNKITSIYNKIIANNSKDPLYPLRVPSKRGFSLQHDNSRNLSLRKQKIEKMGQRTVQKFVGELVTSISKSKQQQDSQSKTHQQKINLLKRIIEHYNLKSIANQHYLNMNKSFGLKVENINVDNIAVKKNIHPRTNQIRMNIKTSVNSRNHKQYNKNSIVQSLDAQISKIYTKQNQSKDQLEKKLLKIQINFKQQDKKQKQRKNQRSERNPQQGKKNLRNQYLTQKLRLSQQSQTRGTINSPKRQFKYTYDDNIDNKIRKYREFLFILNFSNNMYRQLDIEKYDTSYKFYIGSGNNSNLIKSLFKKRFWFQQTSDINQANVIWTQIKNQRVFQCQLSIKNSQDIKENLKQAKKSYLKQRNSLLFDGKNYNNFSFKTNRNIQPIDPYLKILSEQQHTQYIDLMQKILLRKKILFSDRKKYIKGQFTFLNSQIWKEQKVHNHLPMNGYLGNKKAMFYCLREYYKLTGGKIFEIVPLTFHIRYGVQDEQFKLFMNNYLERKKLKKNNIWIIKPGQFSNRGQGITCSSKIQQIRKRVIKAYTKKSSKPTTLIIQSYIINPLLYNFRKFDIRAYMLVTCHNSKIKAYWYQQGYVRTSSYIWNTSELEDTSIHLTNDAIQKNCEDYGRYEPGNKLSYQQMQRYLDTLPSNGRNMDFYNNICPQMKAIATDTICATYLTLDKKRLLNNFQIFGLDFMVDDKLKVWLIQVNTNPCLELSCSLLGRIIPHMLQNSFRIVIDALFPPPSNLNSTYKYIIPQNALYYNKYQLIFDEDRDEKQIKKLYEGSSLFRQIDDIQEDKDQYSGNGVVLDLQDI